jgi:hypothetical protein
MLESQHVELRPQSEKVTMIVKMTMLKKWSYNYWYSEARFRPERGTSVTAIVTGGAM